MSTQGLDTLRDVHLPPAPALWATTEAWYLAAAVALVITWTTWRFLRRRRLRTALRALRRLANAHAVDGNTVDLGRGLSQLLREHAVACFPQCGVEGLTGNDWLAFLDTHGGHGRFTRGAGAVLESLPYQACGSADAAALIDAAACWLKANPR